MHRRGKQVVYGIFYAVIFLTLLGGAYRLFLHRSPSCVDNLLNQDEEEIDCGGVACESCAFKNKKPLILGGAEIFPFADNQSTIVFNLRNPNNQLGKNNLQYTINVYDENNDRALFFNRTTFVYPGETLFIVEPGIRVPSSAIKRAELIIEDKEDWLSIDVFHEPKNISLSNLTSSSTLKGLEVSGTMSNDNAFILENVEVVASMSNKLGFRAGASKTIIDSISAFSARDIHLFIPLSPDQIQNIDKDSLHIIIRARQ